MSDIKQLIVKNVASGKIDKEAAIELMKSILKSGDANSDGKDIAIIGMSIKAPDADNQDEFWTNLKMGVESVGEFPGNRARDCKDIAHKYSNIDKLDLRYEAGGYLREIDKFDYTFFGISPMEASLMDPHQRLFLQSVWETIEDAGYGGKRLAGSKTGVFLGYNSGQVYGHYISNSDPTLVSISVTGNISSITAGRVAHMLDLRGPSILIDTACSSSLVALHTACKSIRTGECENAIVGGVKIQLVPVKGIYEIGIEAKSQRTKTFDDNSDGTVWGEGVITVLLKPLSRALRDKDSIYAVIKGSAANQDGKSSGVTAPNAAAQADVIAGAWKDADIDPVSISYIEAHGTGTRLGDPIEIEGIQRAFKKYTDKKQFCAISSVKPNIGHLDSASGMAGFVKAVLALKHAQIPASIGFGKPNRLISFETSPIFVNDRLLEWKTQGTPRRCGVSAFGFSGTNCHVVLEEAPKVEEKGIVNSDKTRVLTISAKSLEALNKLVDKYKEIINTNGNMDFDGMCYTAAAGRGHYSLRLAIVFNTKEELKIKLSELELTGEKLVKTNDGVYFRKHRIVSDMKDICEDGEITEKGIRILNREADGNLKEYIAGNKADAGKLNELCEMYISGAEINWEEMYRGDSCSIVRLPVYPFEQNRCWVEIPDNEKTKRVDIDEILNVEALPEELAREIGPALLKLKEYYKLDVNNGSGEKGFEIRFKGDSGQLYSDTEKWVAEVWCKNLGIKEISIYDNFMELGGDSLFALKIVNAININKDGRVRVADIIKYPTVKEFAAYIDTLNREESGDYKHVRTIEPVEEQEYYAVSSAQKRTFLVNMMEKQSITYNIPSVTLVEGSLDAGRLEDTFKKLVKRHESLRTSFKMVNGEILQRVHGDAEFELSCFECGEDRAAEVIKEFIRPFDLSTAPLFRAALIKLTENRHIIVFDMHHIISDGTSSNLIMRDIISLYNKAELPELRIQYKDYSAWQNKLLKTEELKRQKEYWLNLFAGEIPVLNLPADYPRPSVQSFEGSGITFEIGRELTEKLAKTASKNGATLYMVLLSAFYVLLHKYTGQEDFVVGSPIGGRENAELENIVGMFVNTLAMRNYPKSSMRFADFMEEVKINSLQAYENQSYQFEELVENLDIKRDLSRNPLFDVMFAMQNVSAGEMTIEGLRFKTYEFEGRVSKFDINLNATEISGKVRFDAEYSTKLFKKETMDRMAGHFVNILSEIAEYPDKKLSEIELMPDSEKAKILDVFNDTLVEYEKDKTIQEMIERQAAVDGDAAALVFGGKSLTYRELNGKANQLAWSLREKGVKPGSIVAILVKRSLEMIVGMLAILKAGGAYLPLDPDYPQDRISYMLTDSGTKIILTQRELLDKLGENEEERGKVVENIEVLDIRDERVYSGKTENPDVLNTSGDLAYLIYTSGSTGKPKGVMLEHKPVINFHKGITDRIDFKAGGTILALTTISFDIHVLEIFLPLMNGMKIVIADEWEQRDGNRLNRLMDSNDVEMLQTTPSRMQLLLKGSSDLSCLKKLKTIMVGGEALPQNLLAEIKERTKARIFNMYGPTETTVWSTVGELTNSQLIDIGTPIANTKVYIVDKANNILPVGVPGELCIAGDGLARGYLDRPELTDEKFVPDTFNKLSTVNCQLSTNKMYRTGDLARWLPDGRLECLGRLDQQVKIRGYRIEPGEIEKYLGELEGVKECVVTAKTHVSGNSYLAAYYSADSEIPIPEIRSYLSKNLPEYMIPDMFVYMDKLPSTPNGKIDRKSLPEPDYSRPSLGRELKKAETETEKTLTMIWQNILNREDVGTEDSFFDVGGNSLLLVMMHAEIEKLYPGKMEVADIFAHPNIAALAKMIDKAGEKGAEGIDLSTLKTPDIFFNDNNDEKDNNIIRFSIDSVTKEKLEQGAVNSGAAVGDILLGAFVYLFHEATDSMEVGINIIVDGNGSVLPAVFDMEKLESIKQLIREAGIKQKGYTESQLLKAAWINRMRPNKREGEILLLFSHNAGRSEAAYSQHFDVMLKTFEENNSVECIYEYDSSRLDKEKMEGLAYYYIQAVEAIVET